MSVLVKQVADMAGSVASYIEPDKRNLLLLSGGSFTAVVREVVQAIVDLPAFKSTEIIISLTDEHYFEDPNHPDANFVHLKEKISDINLGPKLVLLPILEENLSLEQATKKFDAFITNEIHSDTNIIAVMGVGRDGHVMGILPHKQEYHRKFTKNYVTGYRTLDVVKDEEVEYPHRITLNFNGVMKVDHPILYAVGEAKYKILKKLIGMSSPTHKEIAEVPVHYLHTLKHEVEVFTDQELFD